MRWFFLLPALLFADTEFLLIRHGETNWNIENRMQGQADNPLNEKGLEQAALLAQKLYSDHSDITAIYSSDLIRAQTTAAETAVMLGLPVATDPAFREYNWGDVDGWDIKTLHAQYKPAVDAWKEAHPDRHERWNTTVYPNSETFNALLNRFRDGLLSLADAHPDQKIAIFTHARAIRTMMAETLDVDVDTLNHLPNCAVVHLKYDPETGVFTLGEIEEG